MAESTTPKVQKSSFFSTDFLQKLFLLMLGFVCTTILGAFLSYYFQERTNFHNYQNALVESERKTAKDIFEDITTGMDERIYYAQVVNDDYSFHLRKEVSEEKWGLYKKSLDNWNININKHLDLVGLYFDNISRRQWGEIHLGVIELNVKLNKAKS